MFNLFSLSPQTWFCRIFCIVGNLEIFQATSFSSSVSNLCQINTACKFKCEMDNLVWVINSYFHTKYKHYMPNNVRFHCFSPERFCKWSTAEEFVCFAIFSPICKSVLKISTKWAVKVLPVYTRFCKSIDKNRKIKSCYFFVPFSDNRNNKEW